MNDEILSVLKHIYGSSGIPAAITDYKLKVLWRNPAADSARCPLKRDSLAEIFENKEPSAGTVCFTEKEKLFRFNVLAADTAGGRIYILELISSDEVGTLLSYPGVRDYMIYLCERIRESAGMIAVSADEINSAAAVLGADRTGFSDQLDTINKGIMLILREIIDPEQLYRALDPCCDDAVISVADEVKRLASDARRALGKTAKVSLETENGIFTRMNRSIFETIISDMAAECFRRTSFAEQLVFSCGKLGSDRAFISVRCIKGADKKMFPSEFGRSQKGGSLYADYLCRTVCEKYGAEFTGRELSDGYSCSLELPIHNSGSGIVMSASKFSAPSERFNTMTLSLAEYHLEKRYGADTMPDDDCPV